MEDNHRYRAAKKIVRRKKRFYRHLAVYCIVNLIFFFVVFFDTGTFEWLFPASFWGIGLAINYFSVFGLPGSQRLGSSEWEAKELQKEMEKMGGTTTYEELPQDELELKEIKKQPRSWDESDLV